MNILTTSFLLLISIVFETENQGPNAMKNETVKIEEFKTNLANEVIIITDELYNLQIEVETTEDNKYNLVISIELYNGTHFISPHAKRDFKGKFHVDLGSYTQVDFKGDIIETPRSVEEFDKHPFVNGNVNWVRVNTIYKQPLQIKSVRDFEVFGRIQFTIEPRCSFEEIPFVISYKDGKFSFIDPKC